MNTKSTLAGLLVLALVAAGVYWTRSGPPSLPAGNSPSASAGQASSTQGSTAHPAGDEALPDVTLAEAFVDAGGVRLTLSLSPNPPVAFAKTRVLVRAEAGGAPVLLEGGRVTFEMAMPMGDHRYSLVPGEQGWQQADVVLPLCPSGKRRWYATVEGTAAGQPRTARFRLDLKP